MVGAKRRRFRKRVTPLVRHVNSQVASKARFTVRQSQSLSHVNYRGMGLENVLMDQLNFDARLPKHSVGGSDYVSNVLSGLCQQYAKARVRKITMVLSHFSTSWERVMVPYVTGNQADLIPFLKNYMQDTDFSTSLTKSVADNVIHTIQPIQAPKVGYWVDRVNSKTDTLVVMESEADSSTLASNKSQFIKYVPINQKTRLAFTYYPHGLAIGHDMFLKTEASQANAYFAVSGSRCRRAAYEVAVGQKLPDDFAPKLALSRMDRVRMSYVCDTYVQLEFSGRYDGTRN